MTAAGHPPTIENTAKTSALEADARTLAETQSQLQRAKRLLTPYFDPSSVARALEHAQKHLASRFSGEASLPKAAEWFLDNYYLIRRVARQVADELPRGFVRHLPEVVAGPSKGLLRVDALARAIVARTKIELDVATLRRFIETDQQVSPLTIAELWALPTVLRTCVLERLLQFLDELHIPIHSEHAPVAARVQALDAESLELEPGEGVERSIRTLRLLDAVDWKGFFEKTNRVDAILRKDPAGVYQRMDFETCDSYRKVVEALAWGTGRTEEDVAELAVAFAREHVADPRGGHVGHHLMGGGRPALEARLGYRPVGLDRVRRAVTHWPTLFYLSSLALLTAVPLLACGGYLVHRGLSPLSITIAMVVAALPVSMVAGTVLQWALAHLLPPRTLPKLDFIKGLPAEFRSVVVIPTLLGRPEDVEQMTRQLELHYLSNPDPQLQFALLTDDLDSRTMPENEGLLESATERVVLLNAKHGKDGHGPFHLLHREPRWNPAEKRFMGWERKRGKLEEFNRLLRGDKATSYRRHVGDPKGLEGVRFVITLDSDTELPMGSARRMIGLLAHPLNCAAFDTKTGRVTSGYTIVQPRIEISPSSARRTRFSRIAAGDIGFDIYTHAVSEVYQDLFGSGIYVGKGIYDVDAFTHSRSRRGCSRTCVVNMTSSKVSTAEPRSRPTSFCSRAIPRTTPRTRCECTGGCAATGNFYRGSFRRCLRRTDGFLREIASRSSTAGKSSIEPRCSLSGPFLFLLLVLGWIWLPGSALLWTLGALAILVGPALPALARDAQMRPFNLARLGLAVAFIAYEASVAFDAIVRVVVRMTITRRHLLE